MTVTVTLLVAHPSPTLAVFASHGVGKERARLLSDLMEHASHDCRQYTRKTKNSAKQLKYF